MIDSKNIVRVCPNCKRRSKDIHETICIKCGHVTKEEKQVVTKGFTKSETTLD